MLITTISIMLIITTSILLIATICVMPTITTINWFSYLFLTSREGSELQVWEISRAYSGTGPPESEIGRIGVQGSRVQGSRGLGD